MKSKTMWYAVDKDGTKTLYEHKPIREDDEWNMRDEDLFHFATAEILNVQDGEVASMGLPDMTWEDEPIKVILICVNAV